LLPTVTVVVWDPENPQASVIDEPAAEATAAEVETDVDLVFDDSDLTDDSSDLEDETETE
ncbi:MAG: hypothetical protein ACRD1H_17355, partial [Vicinamibacterales bacterium]